MKRRLNKKHLFEAIITTISCVVLLLFTLSYIDVVTHNNPFDDDYKDYASWNVFTLFEE